MRILHLANGRLYGGLERMLATLAESQGLLRHLAFDFAVCHEGRLERELHARGAEVHSLGNVRLSRPATLLRARRQLRVLLAERRYAALVCHAPWTLALFGGLASPRGVALVFWQHGRATGDTLIERAARRVPAALVLCNSHWTATSADLLQPGVPRRVVYCPVPAAAVSSSRAPLRAAFGASESDVVILAASRLERGKGHLELVQALAAVPSRQWVLWVAGAAQRPHETRYLAEVQAACRTFALDDRVRFIGERQDMPAVLEAADVLAQANTEPEAFGIIFAEALLGSRPVVTTRMGGAPEIVDDSCGRLVAPRDIAALSRALAELVADRPLRVTLGAAGPAHAAARCDPAVVLPALEEALLAAGAHAAA